MKSTINISVYLMTIIYLTSCASLMPPKVENIDEKSYRITHSNKEKCLAKAKEICSPDEYVTLNLDEKQSKSWVSNPQMGGGYWVNITTIILDIRCVK